MEPLVRLEHIVKKFPGVLALSDVSFELFPGEVHALVGENGAGKSTLIKTLLGAYIPTAGKIFFNTKEVVFKTPFDASKLGIEGVHQELMLVPWLSVTQNIFLNREKKFAKTRLFDIKNMNKISRELLLDFGIDIDVTQPVKKYSPSTWKMIDIARVINIQPKVIIFDEPTAILTEREVDSLFKKILELKKQNMAIVYISHRLEELRKIADRVTIMRDGKKIASRMVAEVTDDDIVKMMVGRDVGHFYNRNINKIGSELIRFENVFLQKGQKNISMSVCRGEIVGLAGLVGSGRTEIAESIMGINKILSGDLFYKSEPLHFQTPKKMIEKGTYLVPENRKYQGLILSFSVAFNLCLSIFSQWSKFLYRKKQEAFYADESIAKLSIKTPSGKQLVRNLSGGNQQKVVIGKSLLTKTDFLIFDEPTVGVDIGAKEEIHTLMDNFVKNNGGILMISSDLPEVLGMCDRVYVMYEGKIVQHFTRSELSEEAVAAYMLGSKKGEAI